jgi:hypothetical protein
VPKLICEFAIRFTLAKGPKGGEMLVTIAEKLDNEGMEKGMEEGREEI